MDRDNCKTQNYELLEENLKVFHDFGLGKDFGYDSKAHTTKAKLKSFCMAKETLNRSKRQPTEWKKISAIYSSEKGLISRIYMELRQINIKKILI